MSTPVSLVPAKAQFTPQTGPNKEPIPVHFNPVSLQYSVTNTLKEDSKSKKQYVTQGTGKLTMDLIFDNTADGKDVRWDTSKIAALMLPAPKSSGSKKQVASIVLFEWGSYKFQGMMESYKETLDFFAPAGVPLRASVNISMVEQDKIFSRGSAETAGDVTPDAVNVPAGPNADPSSLAAQGGDPGAARALAALNGQHSLRFSAGAALTVTGSVTLGPPVAFATGGAGIGLGASAGFGIGVGGGVGISAGAGIGLGASAGLGATAGLGIGGGASFGAGVGAGFSIGGGAGFSAGAGASASIGLGSGASFGASASASASFGISADAGAAFGATASAGVAAADGAFAGLRVSTRQASYALQTDQYLRTSESISVSTGGNADFMVGGQAAAGGSSGLSADVGVNADLRARIQFEVD